MRTVERLPIFGRSCARGANAGAFVTASDVEAKKRSLKPKGDAIDALVVKCVSLAPATRAAWDSFFADWRQWLATDAGFWTAAHDMDRTEQYERELAAWNKKIGAECAGGDNPLPDVPPAPPTMIENLATSAVWLGGIGLGFYVLRATGVLELVGDLIKRKRK